MKNKTTTYIIILTVIAILLAGLLSFFDESIDTGPGKYDTLATCLTDKGAKFYGAFWCPHCREQKKIFGNSAKLLPYIECSTADASGQLQVCTDEKIEGYPTWVFADGSRQGGALTPEELASKTGCSPADTTTATSTTK